MKPDLQVETNQTFNCYKSGVDYKTFPQKIVAAKTKKNTQLLSIEQLLGFQLHKG